MARRKSKHKKEMDFIDLVMQLSSIGTFFLAFYITKSFKASLITALLVFCFTIGLLIVRKMNHHEKLKRSGMADIDKMDGRQFEHYLGILFKNQGYSVNVTKASGDYGADLVIGKDGKKIVVQAKRYSKNVGLKAVQEAQASIAHYGASEAWVVSNSDYTEAAYELAKSNAVKLITRESLINMILKMNPGSRVPTPKQVVVQMPADESKCSRCGGQMVKRKSAKGEFYGCSSFPKCRNVKAI